MSYSVPHLPAYTGLAITVAIASTFLSSGAVHASPADNPTTEITLSSAFQDQFDSSLAQDLLRTNEDLPSHFALPSPDTQITQINGDGEESQPRRRLRVEVMPSISTTGLGVSVAAPVSNYLKARVGFNGFSLGFDAEADGIDYDGDLKLSNFSGGVDVHPFGPKNLFFIGAGLNIQNNRLEASGTASSNQTFDINGTTYSSADVGKLNAEFEYPNRVAPYIGLGVASSIASKSRFGFFANLGVMFPGQPDVSLSAEGPLASDPQFASDLEAETKQAEDDVNFPSVYPIFSFGAGYRF